jgi:ribose transport system ATP-binding protein
VPETLLQIHEIGKSFGSSRVLDGVSMDLRAGEVHVLAGENGAGKSTLIKILGGIYPDYDGRILLADREVRFTGPQDAARRGISVIHQELSLVDTLSIADNICLGREVTRAGGWLLDRRSEAARVREVCAKIGLSLSPADLDRPAGEFPLSVKNQVEIAKALLGEARIFVMDEPSSALNHAEVERLFGLIGSLRRSGCGIIYISHKMEEIYRLADRITVLRDGRLVGTASASECPRPTLIRWMIGRDLAEQFPARRVRPGNASGAVRLSVKDLSVPSPVPGRPAMVRDVSLEVSPGEIVGLAGLQGAGCAEVLQGLFGALGEISEGDVTLDGDPLRPASPADSIQRGVAFLTGDRKANGLVLGMSVEGNLSLASLPELSPRGFLSRTLERRLADRCVEKLGIRLASVKQDVGTLSGGNQQKVVLGKWLETHPRVLFLDEPTRGVDIGAKHEIYRLLGQLAAEGLSILLVSSEMAELIGLCDRIVVLHRGSVAATLSREDTSPERILAAAMGAAGEEPNL